MITAIIVGAILCALFVLCACMMSSYITRMEEEEELRYKKENIDVKN